ncbi:MAG: O-antigen ligase family protein [Candidatus Omnitrophica bacterium]|nr:O-antigen ligase family protein [Candidatus Omnitrophota bacterium]
MQRMLKYLDYIIYWSIVFIPFSISIANAPANIFMGFLIISFLAKKVLKKEPIFIKTAINIPLLLLLALSFLSIFNSIDYSDSLKGGIFRLLRYVFILFIVREELKDERHLAKIIYSIVAGALLVSFDGFWQVLTGRDFVRGYTPVINIGLMRATASFKDPNTLGIYISAFAPLIFGLTLYYFKEKKKMMMFFISLIVLTGALLTYSRPTLLAIYVALFFLGAVRKNKALVIFLIIFTFISPFILPRSVKDWAKEVDHNPLRFLCNDDRIAIYRNSLNMIREHPVIGVGVNNYMKVYKDYKESPEYRNIVTSDYIYAHNNFLHMAAEIGLAGLGIFIWLLYKLFRQCRDIYKKLNSNYFKIISLSFSACLIAFLVNGLTESSLYYSRVAIIFWYLAGLSLSLKKFIHADRTKEY